MTTVDRVFEPQNVRPNNRSRLTMARFPAVTGNDLWRLVDALKNNAALADPNHRRLVIQAMVHELGPDDLEVLVQALECLEPDSHATVAVRQIVAKMAPPDYEQLTASRDRAAQDRKFITLSPEQLSIRTPTDLAQLLRTAMHTAGLKPGQVAIKTGIHRSQVYLLTKPERGSLPRNPKQLAKFMAECHMRDNDIATVLARWDGLNDLRRRGRTPELPDLDPPTVVSSVAETANDPEPAEEAPQQENHETQTTWSAAGHRRMRLAATVLLAIPLMVMIAAGLSQPGVFDPVVDMLGSFQLSAVLVMIPIIVSLMLLISLLRRRATMLITMLLAMLMERWVMKKHPPTTSWWRC